MHGRDLGTKQWLTDEPLAELSQKCRRYSILLTYPSFFFCLGWMWGSAKSSPDTSVPGASGPSGSRGIQKADIAQLHKGEREEKLSAKYSAKMQTIFKAFPATAAPAITAPTSLRPADPERVSMGADIPLGLSHGRAEGCGRRGLKKSLKSLFLLFPLPTPPASLLLPMWQTIAWL